MVRVPPLDEDPLDDPFSPSAPAFIAPGPFHMGVRTGDGSPWPPFRRALLKQHTCLGRATNVIVSPRIAATPNLPNLFQRAP